ncbi:GNAT family N-acetyltransferase [Christiangramia sp. ASW11-125]|uniref:GNAT family N-acetyltransferase n=1 Tax=Christiangramia sp. ASW11-125 TaxID=3400701 RepID=UPI003AAC4783
MLNFRKVNYDEDLDEIIKLIQANLDSSFTPELFIWKHLENPFGKSYGLLATHEKKIVGLRMFMFWNFYNGNSKNIIKAVRPVDTVVDHSYRGKGLFKKLTLTGLEECKDEYDLIFNTPNENSLPGYIKMGWKKIEAVRHFKIALSNPLMRTVPFDDLDSNMIANIYATNHKSHNTVSNGMIVTKKTLEYFKWRYRSNKYRIAYFNSEGVYIAYNINSRYLIINEIFGELSNTSFRLLNSLAIKNGKKLLYFYNQSTMKKLKIPISLNRSKPVVVSKQANAISGMETIDFSLADLESVF